jgi:hypothetical protein
MTPPHRLGWKALLLIGIGVVIGSVSITPAIGHVTDTFTHVWLSHIRPAADGRYVRKCDNGAVKAAAWIGGDGSYDMTTIPDTFTPIFGLSKFSCSGPLHIRRDGVGRYVVAIQDGKNRIAIAVPDQTYGQDNTLAQTGFALHYGDGWIGNSVHIRNHAGTAVDSPFMIWLY